MQGRDFRELHVPKRRHQILADDRAVTPKTTWTELGFGDVLQPIDQELPDGLALRPQGQAKLGAALQFGKLPLRLGLCLGVDLLSRAVLEGDSGDPSFSRRPLVATK
jgi:hypothetical protein